MTPRPIRITYMGHATLLIEIDGLRVLTDPMLRPRVLHLRRVASAIAAGDLEKIDLILISHAHHDHVDVGSLKLIAGGPRVLCPAPARKAVSSAGLSPEVLATGSQFNQGDISIEAVRAEHDGRRMPHHSDTEALGYVLRGPSGSVYFAGDTGFFEAIGEVGSVDVALLPVSGWGPRLGPGHLDPDEAARAAAMIAPRVAIPIHWGSYERVGMKRQGDRNDPARRFADQVAEISPAIDAVLLEPGTSFTLGPVDGSA